MILITNDQMINKQMDEYWFASMRLIRLGIEHIESAAMRGRFARIFVI